MFVLTIETDNDAFYPAPGSEVNRILQVCSGIIEHIDGGELRDFNGNRVGKFQYTDELVPLLQRIYSDAQNLTYTEADTLLHVENIKELADILGVGL